MSNDVNCPYCESPQEINHDDGYGYDENKIHNQHCHECGQWFTYTTSIIFSYEAKQSKCLNGGAHEWQLTHTVPREFSKMECKDCGEIRELTDAERQANGIGTVQEYFEKLKQ